MDIKNLEATIKFEGQQPVAIDKLHCSMPVVHPVFHAGVKKSIEEEGMMFPIVAVDMKRTEWNGRYAINPDILPPPDGEEENIYFVSCGNNRVRIAKSLGYTHIDCIIVGSISDGAQYCSRFQKDYNREWYSKSEIQTSQHDSAEA